MSLADIGKQVLALSEDERRQFAVWFYQNEGKILPPPLEFENGDQTDLLFDTTFSNYADGNQISGSREPDDSRVAASDIKQ